MKKFWKRKIKTSIEQMVFGNGNKRYRPYKRDYQKNPLKPVNELCQGSENATMKIITTNVPDYQLEWMNQQVHNNRYASRSELLRLAIREFIMYEQEFIKFLERKKYCDETEDSIVVNGKTYNKLGDA